MNKLTTIVAASLLIGTGFALSTTVKAQTPAPPAPPAPAAAPAAGHHHESEIQKLTDELTLSPDQVSKITPIIDTAKAQIKAIRQDATLTADQQKAQVGPIRKQENKDIEAQLTSVQLATYKSLRKNHGQPAPVPATTPTVN